MKTLFITLTTMFIVIMFSACSGDRINNSITSPGISPQTDAGIPVGLLVENTDENGNVKSGSGILGLFSAHIDRESLTGELVPLRNLKLDDALEMVDITNFLQLAPCTDCVKLTSIELDSEGHILAKIGIKHPFNPGDPLKPITGRNRADLHVFNVEGTVIFDDSSSSLEFPSLGIVLGPEYLINADGYSPYLDPAVDEIYPTEATIHPYILHFDDYSQGNFDAANPMGFQSVTDPPPTGNLVMAMGCDYDVKNYIFDIPQGEKVDFIFAVGCTYAVSAASKSLRFTPEYQVPQHNKKAASEVVVEIANNNLFPGDHTSSADLYVKVLDINHGVAVGDALNEMQSDSSVSSIAIEVPGVTNSAIFSSSPPTGGNARDPLDPLTFFAGFQNDRSADMGIYRGIVKVLDSYPAGSNGSPLLNGQDAIKRVDPLANPLSGLYSLDEFATYMPFTIEVTATNLPPNASFTSDPPGTPDLSINYLSSVTFTSTSTDPDDPLTPEGQIMSYEWDFVWDGIPANFTDDTGGTGTDIETHQFDVVGIYQVGLRVTDGGTPPLSDIYSIQITVDEWSDEFIVDSNNDRIPKITQMPSGRMMLIWSGQDAKSHYATWDNVWSAADTLSNVTTNYLAVWPGPGQDEAWAAGGIRFYRYTGSTGLWAITPIEYGSAIQTHIYSEPSGGYGVIHNSISAFGWVIRTFFTSFSATSPAWFQEYIAWYPYNNRLIGESRIMDKTSTGQILLVYKQDLAIDPYRPPQDLRYVHCANINPASQGFTHTTPIDQGSQDKLDCVVIACDTLDHFHVAYRSQPDGGGNYSLIYKNSTNGSTWTTQSTFYNGVDAPEYEYVSIDTDSSNNVIVTYHLNNNIYWLWSSNGTTWSSTEIVNESFPGLPTSDKEQYMIVDSQNRTHVVWNRCAAGPVGYGPIRHRIRAPIE